MISRYAAVDGGTKGLSSQVQNQLQFKTSAHTFYGSSDLLLQLQLAQLRERTTWSASSRCFRLFAFFSGNGRFFQLPAAARLCEQRERQAHGKTNPKCILL